MRATLEQVLGPSLQGPMGDGQTRGGFFQDSHLLGGRGVWRDWIIARPWALR